MFILVIWLSYAFISCHLGSTMFDTVKYNYSQVVSTGNQVGFINSKLVNDYWIELCIKSADIADGKFVIYSEEMNSTSGALTGFTASNSLSTYSTAGENDIFEYFDKIGYYHEFFNMQYENEPDSILECLRNDRKYGLPEVIETQLLQIYSESWDSDRIKDFLKIENQFMNVFVGL